MKRLLRFLFYLVIALIGWICGWSLIVWIALAVGAHVPLEFSLMLFAFGFLAPPIFLARDWSRETKPQGKANRRLCRQPTEN